MRSWQFGQPVSTKSLSGRTIEQSRQARRSFCGRRDIVDDTAVTDEFGNIGLRF